ncbi:MAG: hypothetical protein GXC76_14050 [Rhodanobacteraceae bacterium]|jgi:hypothetical protein|nr:hypothetical protein [Rhodanobacteraceae bacterium]
MISRESITLCLTWVVLWLFLLPSGLQAADAANVSDGRLEQFIQKQEHEPGPNVGKTLPADLAVLDSAGQVVELGKALRGPAVVIKAMQGCPPCATLLDYVKVHGDELAEAHGVQFAVLNLASTNADSARSVYPKGVLVLHARDLLMDSLLGGTSVPAVYFFDKNLTLVGMHTGLYDDSEAAIVAALRFPKVTPAP